MTTLGTDSSRQAADISLHSQIYQLSKQDPIPWYRKRNLRMLYLILAPGCLIAEITSGMDSSMLTGLQSVAQWNIYFNYPSGAILGLMGSAYALGSFLSLPLIAPIIDRYGRKAGIIVAAAWIGIGSIIQSCSINIAMFVVARIIMGFGLPTLLTASASLIQELVFPTERAPISSLLSVTYYPGAIVMAGITLSTFARPDEWSWRIPSLMQLLPCVLQLCFIWFVPESPRWLISKGRNSQAFEILTKYHGEGDPEHPLVKAEYNEILNNIEYEQNNTKRSWLELFQTRANRWRSTIALMVGCFSQFSGNNVISYYLVPVLKSAGVTDARTQNVINLSLSCFTFVVGVTASIATRYVRRRVMFLYASIGMLCVFTGWIAASAEFTNTGAPAAGNAVIAMLPLFFLFFQPGMNCLTYVYGVEIWTFSQRARGVTLVQIMSRGLTFIGNFCNPIGLANAGWRYLFLYWSVLWVEIFSIYFIYPETFGLSLEEISLIFESANEGRRAAMVLDDKGIEDHKEHADKTVANAGEGRSTV